MDDPRLGLPSASFLPILAHCRGSWKAVKDLPPETSDAADFGNQVHDLASGQLEEMGATERASYIHKGYERIWSKVAMEIFGNLDGLMVYKETRFFMRNKELQPVFSGQADKIVIRDGVALITDLKALTGAVAPAEENWQLLALAVAFLDDDAKRGDHPVETVYGAIIQPLISHIPKIVQYNVQQLLIARRQIVRFLEEAAMEGAPLTPGTHCRLCRARAHCQAAISLPMLWTAPDLSASTLTAAHVAELYPKLAAVESIIKALRARAKELAATDPTFPYTLRERQGDLVINDLKAARTALEPWVKKEDFNALIGISTGALREIFVTNYAGAEKTTKVEAGKKFLELLASASAREATKQMLVKKE